MTRAGTLVALLALILSACDLPFVGGGNPIGGEESKTPDQVLADAARDTAAQKTVRLVISGTDSQIGVLTYDISIDADGAATGSGALADSRFELVVKGGKSYVKGRDLFVKVFRDVPADTRSGLLDKVDDHWVVGLDLLGPQDGNNNFRPEILADCLQAHGTLGKGATTDVGGRKSIEVIDRGDNPGGTPKSIFVAVDAPHQVTRVTVNGEQTPGTDPDHGKCKGSTAAPAPPASPLPSGATAPNRTTVDIKDYGKPVTVTVPTDTVDFSDILPAGGF
jgi:hypothetical protein